MVQHLSEINQFLHQIDSKIDCGGLIDSFNHLLKHCIKHNLLHFQDFSQDLLHRRLLIDLDWRIIISFEKEGIILFDQYLDELDRKRNGATQLAHTLIKKSENSSHYAEILHLFFREYTKHSHLNRDNKTDTNSLFEKLFSFIVILDWHKMSNATSVLLKQVEILFFLPQLLSINF